MKSWKTSRGTRGDSLNIRNRRREWSQGETCARERQLSSALLFGKARALACLLEKISLSHFPKSVPCQLKRSFYFRVLPEFTLVWILLPLTRGSRRRRRLLEYPASTRENSEHLFSIEELVSKHAIVYSTV